MDHQMGQEGKTNRELAVSQKVSKRRVQQLKAEYKRTGRTPRLSRPGRKRKPIELDHVKLILEEHKETRHRAVFLEKIIYAKHKIRIPHNTIHMVLKGVGISRSEKNKQKRRKPWIRYERKHTLSLVHTDWHDSKVIPGKHVIAFEDDASRKLLAIDEWDEETAENAIRTFEKARKEAEPYGTIRQLLSDRGSQFWANKQNKKGTSKSGFTLHVESKGTQHIVGRVKHPQTNGKIEKWFDCYEKHRGRFKTAEEFREWYNNRRPHMSLNMRYAETPSQAFIRKMDPAVWIIVNDIINWNVSFTSCS